MPSSLATASIWLSVAKKACGSPGARMCPHGILLVYTTRSSLRWCGMLYAPPASWAPKRKPMGLKAP